MIKNLKILFVGLGSIGKRHLRNLCNVAKEQGLNLTIDALRSSKFPLEEEISSLINKEYYNYDDIEYYDCIFITNPTYLHFESLSKLKDKAKAYFIEKPLEQKALSSKQLEIFKDNNIYYIACPVRHTAVFKELQKIVQQNKIFTARAICSSFLPEWRPNTDYRQVYSAKKESGGVKVDLIHDFDYLFTLFGYPQKYSIYAKKISNLEIDSYDYTSFIGEYDDKFVELHLDYFGRIPTREVEIYTENDVILVDFINAKIRINNKWQNYDEERNVSYVNEIKYFLSLINGEIENINDIQKANKTLEIIGE